MEKEVKVELVKIHIHMGKKTYKVLEKSNDIEYIKKLKNEIYKDNPDIIIQVTTIKRY